MQLQQVCVKYFVEDPSALDTDALIPIFHRWIREHQLTNKMLIDVADYSHMHQGPGVLLMGHEEIYSVDEAFGEQGLLYVRKRGAAPKDPATGVRNALSATLRACALLEQHPDLRTGFDLTRVQFRIHNRLVAQNTAATFHEVEPLLQATLSELFDTPVLLSHDPRQVEAQLRLSGPLVRSVTHEAALREDRLDVPTELDLVGPVRGARQR